MGFSRLDETALIQTLYSAATQAGDGAWRAFLAMLSNMTRADIAALVIQAEDQKTVTVSAQNIPNWLTDALGPDDPMGLGRLRYERVYSQDDLPDSDHVIRVVRTQAPDGSVWLLLQKEREDFRAVDAALLSFLSPHLGTSAGIWSEFGRNSLDFQLKQRLTDSLDSDWIAFDQNGRTVDMGECAKQHRIALDPDLIRQVVKTQSPRSTTSGDFDIHLTPFTADMTTAQSPIACVALIRNPNPKTLPDVQTVTDTLDIAKAEARVAALLAQGHSLSESADRLGLTIETARNYTKRIFAQTGLKGQPDLVRRVLNGVARFR